MDRSFRVASRAYQINVDWFIALAVLAFLVIVTLAYATVALRVGSWLVPGVEIDDFSTAVTAAISFTTWRFLLGIPAAALVYFFTTPLHGDAVRWQDTVLAMGIMFAVDLYSMWRAELSAVHFKITNIVSRVVLTVFITAIGAGTFMTSLTISF